MECSIDEAPRTNLGSFPLGNTVCHDGVVFRVWAPHAEAVSVGGDWNDWDPSRDPLSPDGEGNWEGFAREAREGDEYRFFIVNGKTTLSRIDPRTRKVSNSAGNGIITTDEFEWQGDAFDLPLHHKLVIYELHAKTFAQDSSKSASPFEQVIDRMDHLTALGVNAIQLMPVAEFAGDLSWGYNPAHPFAVESSYGGPEGLKTLVKEAHRRGIGVILDVVYNHFGPSDLDLWQFDGWSENDRGGIYFYNDWKAETPWGETRPDYGRGEVRQFIHDNAMMWLDAFHLDGLRYDMTLFMRSVRGDSDPGSALPDGWSLAQWINGEAREKFPRKIFIAEDLQNESALTRKREEEGAGFHAQWDAAFVHPVRETIIPAGDESRSMQAIADALRFNYNGDAFQRVIYTESHDEVANGKARVPHEISPQEETDFFARKRSSLGACLMLTAPGIPMLFQGQEFLEGEWFRDDVPVDWDRQESFAGMVRLYRDLIALRLNRSGVSLGLSGQGIEITHLNEEENLLAYHRWYEGGVGDSAIIICNLSNSAKEGYEIAFPTPGRWKLRLNSDSRIYIQSSTRIPPLISK